MAVTFAIDISHHQDKSLSLVAARRDGCELAILKAGEGSTFVDPDFAANLAEARAAGQLVAAYWYQRSTATAAQHVAKILQVVPRDVAVIVDVEAGSGGVALTREVVRLLLAAGYRAPLLYLPRWYWQQIGSPSLAGLPPLWSSRYPNNVVGLLASEWAEVPASYWTGYGGLDVGLLQFTSSARIAGYQPLDASAFRGTRDQLAALLGGATAPTRITEDRIVKLEAKLADDGTPLTTFAEIPVMGGKSLRLATSYGNTVQVNGVTGVYDTNHNPQTVPVQGAFTLAADRPGPINGDLPAGLSHVVVQYVADEDFTGWCY